MKNFIKEKESDDPLITKKFLIEGIKGKKKVKKDFFGFKTDFYGQSKPYVLLEEYDSITHILLQKDENVPFLDLYKKKDNSADFIRLPLKKDMEWEYTSK